MRVPAMTHMVVMLKPRSARGVKAETPSELHRYAVMRRLGTPSKTTPGPVRTTGVGKASPRSERIGRHTPASATDATPTRAAVRRFGLSSYTLTMY